MTSKFLINKMKKAAALIFAMDIRYKMLIFKHMYPLCKNGKGARLVQRKETKKKAGMPSKFRIALILFKINQGTIIGWEV